MGFSSTHDDGYACSKEIERPLENYVVCISDVCKRFAVYSSCTTEVAFPLHATQICFRLVELYSS